MGDAALAVVPHFLFRHFLAVLQADPGQHRFPELFVGKPQHVHIGDFGMAVQELLDLFRVERLSGGFRLIVVTFHDVVPARAEFAGLAGFHDLGIPRGHDLHIQENGLHARLAQHEFQFVRAIRRIDIHQDSAGHRRGKLEIDPLGTVGGPHAHAVSRPYSKTPEPPASFRKPR